jgi:hypothetical protein
LTEEEEVREVRELNVVVESLRDDDVDDDMSSIELQKMKKMTYY